MGLREQQAHLRVKRREAQARGNRALYWQIQEQLNQIADKIRQQRISDNEQSAKTQPNQTTPSHAWVSCAL